MSTAMTPWEMDASPGASKPASPLHTGAGRRFAWAAGAAALLGTVYVAWTQFQVGGETATTAFDDIGLALCALAASLCCGLTAWRSERRLRLAWGLLGAGVFFWFAGESIWTYYEVGQDIPVPFPSLADVAYLLGYPLAIAGVLALPSAPGRVTSRLQTVLNAGIVSVSLIFISWALGLASVYQASPGQPALQLIGAAYPVADVFILSALLMTLRRADPRQRGAIVLLLTGLAAYAFTDSGFAFLTAAGNPAATSGLLNAGYLAGYFLIALAALWPASIGGRVSEEGPIELWQMFAPWVGIFGAGVITGVRALQGIGLDTFESAAAAVLAMLVVATMVMLHRDSLALLTDRDRTASALESRSATLDQVVTHAPLGIARVGVDLRILEANPRLGSLLHAPAKIMVGSLVSDYLADEEIARLLGLWKPLWEGAVETVEGDSPTRRADGTELWLHWSVTSVRKTSGHIEYFLAMFEDITAKHEAQEAAMANLEGLERLNKLKSEFVSMVSHEFRTALVGIQGFSEILRDENIEPGEVKSLAGDINNDAQRLNRMIGEMLDLDRMEAGKIRLNPRPVDMNALVDDTIDRVRVVSESHVIRTELDRALPVVTGDADRLVQVLSNLLTNAMKYSPEGGEVKVSTYSEDGQVVVSVADHGVGIAPEFVSRLFGRYERFESNRISKVVGTGLGLAISRQIVELHGGQIWVDSKPGEGSTFRFSIPMATAPER